MRAFKNKNLWWLWAIGEHAVVPESNAPVFRHGYALYWVRRAIAPERLPQLLYQAKLEVHHHVQDGLWAKGTEAKRLRIQKFFTKISDLKTTALFNNTWKQILKIAEGNKIWPNSGWKRLKKDNQINQ